MHSAVASHYCLHGSHSLYAVGSASRVGIWQKIYLPTRISNQRLGLARWYNTASSSSTSATPVPESEILEEHKGSAVILTLNRPKSLNALNLSMVRVLTPKYQAWHTQPTKSMVVVMKGAGGKAFCAGGDIRAMYDLGLAWRNASNASDTNDANDAEKTKASIPTNDSEIATNATSFFREEYKLNHLIATLPQPHVALLDGITMGGGVGLSVHGKFRVATENTVFAMPETGIGFFCDVGGSYFLPRLVVTGEKGRGRGLGLYLALTGNRLKAGAVLEAGIATHYVPAAKLKALEEALANSNITSSTGTVTVPVTVPVTVTVQGILDRFAEAPPSQDAIQHIKEIDQFFGPQHDSVDSIIAALESAARNNGGSWAQETLKALSRASPTSLRVVFRELREGEKRSSLAECLKMEYRIASAFLHPSGPSRDFFEGVRATLVDKDKNYKWNPNTIEKVSEANIRPFFERIPTGGDLAL